MFSLVRRYLKTAIGFLIAGLVLGAWMLARRELWGIYPTSYEISAHTHAIVVGFVMMMIQGVALWLFPRPASGDDRYRPGLAAAAFWFVALGTGIRFAGELLRPLMTGLPLGLVIVAAGLAQAIGIILFFFNMLPRIRAVGSALREAKGEKF